jgi:hypothetical protein
MQKIAFSSRAKRICSFAVGPEQQSLMTDHVAGHTTRETLHFHLKNAIIPAIFKFNQKSSTVLQVTVSKVMP